MYGTVLFKTNIDIEQDSALSPILSTIYIALIFHIFKKRTQSLLSPILIFTFSFVDDRLLISQEKNYEKLNTDILCGYNIILFLFTQFGLIIKHDKSEVFHFSRLTKNICSSLLDLCLLGGHIEISQFLFQQETIFLILCLSLCQQSPFYNQKHENVGKLK